jgi:hypothetical protein
VLFAGEMAQGNLGVVRLLLVDHGSHEAASVAIRTLHHHHPDVGVLGDDLHVIVFMMTMANATRAKSLQDYFSDPIFVVVHGNELQRRLAANT